MTTEFYGEQFDKYERMYSKPYVGYFTHDGKLVNYNTPLGGSHGSLGNIVSWTFLLWIKQSELFEQLGLNIKTSAKLNINSGSITGVDIAVNEASNLSLLQRDLINFLQTARFDNDFINKLNEKIDKSRIPTYVTKDKKIPYYVGVNGSESPYEIEALFGKYNTKELLLFLKDICVQYLGYDSIEQVKPNGEILTFPLYYAYYPLDYYTYLDKPRVITSSDINTNERYYNYLLMDWKVQKVPKYVYNSSTHKFEMSPEQKVYIQPQKEEIYKEEIESIRKLVPLKERMKYFR